MKVHRWLAGLLAALALGNTARAVDVGGVYENLGTVVALDGEKTGGGAVTLHGLLVLEFDHALGTKLYGDTAQVEVTQLDPRFRIICKDRDGKETWTGQWQYREGYARTEDQVNLIFRSKRYENDGFLFILRTINDRQMLMVEVRHIVSSWLGPTEKPVGTFLFDRVVGSAVGRDR